MFNTEYCWQTAQFYSPVNYSMSKETNFKPIFKSISVHGVYKYFGSRCLQVFRFKVSTSISVQGIYKYFGSRCLQVFRFKVSTSISVQDVYKYFGSKCLQVFRFKVSTSISSECNKAAIPRTGHQ